MAHRVGDRLLLESLRAGSPVLLSRSAPDFTSARRALDMPLSDPFLSRKPLTFSVGPEGQLRLDPGESGKVSVAGELLRGARGFSPEEVAAGVLVELAKRVVLLLHLAETGPAGAVDKLGMVGTSAGMQRVRRHIEQVADLNVPVLIRGETGSGKELIARAIHQCSTRRDRAFISVNLGAIPKELAAAELFGARKGSFTGAVRDQQGFFQAAHGGTLFLDEVGEASPEVQVMLLRVLETREIYPVGERTPIQVDVRLVAATDAHLEERIQQGHFKAPLLHRLAGYEIRVPPLRERREDIGLLFHTFAREELQALGEAHRLQPDTPTPEPWLPTRLACLLVSAGWPGNIRQLRNVTRQLVIDSRGQPSLLLEPRLEQELSASMGPPVGRPPAAPAEPERKAGVRRKLTDHTEAEIAAALDANGWEIKASADQLGVARSSLYDWLERTPHLQAASSLSAEEFTRCHGECGGDLDALARRLKLSRWAIVRRVKVLGLTSTEMAP
jgi:two-component system nitrogen regulation response regulator GlnG